MGELRLGSLETLGAQVFSAENERADDSKGLKLAQCIRNTRGRVFKNPFLLPASHFCF